MSRVEQADVIIIGGGLMGCATALFLAKAGRSVIVLERDLTGRKASGTNFGAVRRQGRPISQMPLANLSRELWWRMNELVGEDCEFVRRGHLRIALDEKAAAKMEAYAPDARHAGLDLETLSRAQIAERFPWLSDRVVLASFSPLDGHANPRLTGPAFGRAARRAGAVIHENTHVLHLSKPDDFEAVAADGRVFRAPAMMIAAGAWSGAFASTFGEAGPMDIRGPQLSVTEPLPYFIGPNTSAASSDSDYSVYFRQVARGNIVIGGPRHGPASLVTGLANVLPENLVIQLSRARAVMPLLARTRTIRSWSGVEGYTPDGQPVMGASPTVPGLYFAFGFSGAGFQLGPGVGAVMAALIDTGTAPIDMSPYRPGRFPFGISAEGAAMRMLNAKGG